VLHEGLTDRNFRCAPGTWRLQRCEDCRSAYLDPRPTAGSVMRAYSSYYTHVDPGDAAAGGGARGRLKRLWRRSVSAHLDRRRGFRFGDGWEPGARVVGLVPPLRAKAERKVRNLVGAPGGRVLDVGCGDSSFVIQMRDAGWQAEGIDPDERAVRLAQEAGLPVVLGNATREDLPEGPYDAITLSHVIEHLHDPLAAIEACASRLRPGGVLWVATPNLDGVGHRAYGRDWFHLDPPRHLVLFTRGSLTSLVRAAGLVDVEALTPPPASTQALTASAALRAGGDPLAPAVGRAARAGGLAADLTSVLRPGLGEELVVVGRAPAR
jgi:2-polyprenyl-3-methyl-5-hydroxy-6-metoxy-1,4-benzoquinol methylase